MEIQRMREEKKIQTDFGLVEKELYLEQEKLKSKKMIKQ